MEVGTTVKYKDGKYKILSKALIDFSVLNNVIIKADVYGLSIGLFWEEQLEAVESFEDMAARTQTTDTPKPVTYTAKEMQEMEWQADLDAHNQIINEQNELHR